jgi:O-antigen ligase
MTTTATTLPLFRLRTDDAAYWALIGFVAALQVSIAAAHVLLALTLVAWIAASPARQLTFDVPRMFWPLAAYAGISLLAAVFSTDPSVSLFDSKQLVLFLIVPAVYQLARGHQRPLNIVLVIITVAAASAAFGIYQYGILKYDFLGKRPQGTLGHYMTYSGLLMLVIAAAVGRLLFRPEERTWPALVLPALVVALATTFTRSAWIGACAAVALLFILKDFRLLAVFPIAVALFIALAPPRVTDRLYSIFDMNDPTNRDRFAMMRAGAAMIRDHPVIGIGPDAVRLVYSQYRDPGAVELVTAHLHNVPLQIAVERGLPALAVWLWFVVWLTMDLFRQFRRSAYPALAATGLAAVAAMLAAGMFEYNFGDSEFLMLFLVLVTLPFAAERPEPSPA